MLSRLLVALAFTLLLLPTVAAADALDDGVRRVALQLQCPVCEGQSVADSNSGLAKDMRTLIRVRIAAGVPDQQILDEFVASYGDSILSEPPKRGIALGVWLGPAAGLLFGALIVAVLLLSWRHPRRATPGPLATLDPDVADELHRFRNEFGR
ncbi:MAG TPA: cytochrome c-type biogenesis protein [Chloroflexota bacterium]|nr:cytochrome c-type biogenesis protein [Chloroflexota bacterium]